MLPECYIISDVDEYLKIGGKTTRYHAIFDDMLALGRSVSFIIAHEKSVWVFVIICVLWNPRHMILIPLQDYGAKY